MLHTLSLKTFLSERLFCLGLLCAFVPIATANSQDGATQEPPVAIVIHGGAGALEPGRYTSEQEAAFKAKLNEALDAGYGVLDNGGTALDAVEAAIVLMEDSPLFNAGRGAVFSYEGKNELDAAIMDGKSLNAGAITGVRKIKNPIRLARKVMEESVHVMFAGEGAEEFANDHNIEEVKPKYFFTENRWRTYKEALKEDRRARKAKKKLKKSSLPIDFKFGTVGAELLIDLAILRQAHPPAA